MGGKGVRSWKQQQIKQQYFVGLTHLPRTHTSWKPQSHSPDELIAWVQITVMRHVRRCDCARIRATRRGKDHERQQHTSRA